MFKTYCKFLFHINDLNVMQTNHNTELIGAKMMAGVIFDVLHFWLYVTL